MALETEITTETRIRVFDAAQKTLFDGTAEEATQLYDALKATLTGLSVVSELPAFVYDAAGDKWVRQVGVDDTYRIQWVDGEWSDSFKNYTLDQIKREYGPVTLG